MHAEVLDVVVVVLVVEDFETGFILMYVVILVVVVVTATVYVSLVNVTVCVDVVVLISTCGAFQLVVVTAEEMVIVGFPAIAPPPPVETTYMCPLESVYLSGLSLP